MAKTEQNNPRAAGARALFLPRALLLPLALGVLLPTVAGVSQAGQMDCGELAARLNPGDRYQFKIELQSKSIRLEKGDDFCSEPVADWFARKLILPRPARDNRPRPAAKVTKPALKPKPEDDTVPMPSVDGAVSLPGQIMRQGPLPDLGLDSGGGSAATVPTMRVPAEKQDVEQPPVEGEIVQPVEDAAVQPVEGGAPVKQAAPGIEPATPPTRVEMKVDETPPMAGVVAPPPPKVDPDVAKLCDRLVTDFWAPGEYDIDGRMFWLSGVFTIDYNGDGRIDDVGFKLNAEGKIGNVLNYFPTSGDRLSGKTVASLKLDDERDISRLCADNVTFVRPEPEIVAPKKAEETKQEATTAPKRSVTGSAEKAAEATPEKQPEPEVEVKKTAEGKTSDLILWMSGIAMVLVLFGIVGFIFFLKGTAPSSEDDDGEYEEDEEYEEEDED